MNYRIESFKPIPKCEITLPTSKSISNRLLIIKALSNKDIKLINISESDDTKHMIDAFIGDAGEINIGHAGTSMRFLTAYYAAIGKKKVLTGSTRMKERPIRELVNALNQLGAEITYAEKEGFPPIITSGKTLTGNQLTIKGNISSQYITALLLIAPVLPNGLTIKITGELISSSYVALTLGLMKYFGVNAIWKENRITIAHQKYSGTEITVEADWSGASYWYEVAALSGKTQIKINGVSSNSLQGDAALVSIFEKLGIHTEFVDNAAILTNTGKTIEKFEFDFINNPDLIQTMVVTLCLLKIPFKLSGAQTLRIKETDRIAALQVEMKKFGFVIEEPKPGILQWNGNQSQALTDISIDTYNDHRMALAFAPAAIFYPGLTINNAEVVSKSYPGYWEDLSHAGFKLNA